MENLKQYGIRELKDGLTLDKIKSDFSWLLEAKIKDAILGFDKEYNNLIWYYGEWMSGEWVNGYWKDGIWHDGRWLKNDKRANSWEDGIWKNGIWDGGYRFGGDWRDGVWNYGYWYGGVWRKGIWKNGYWMGGIWIDGVWEDGVLSAQQYGDVLDGISISGITMTTDIDIEADKIKFEKIILKNNLICKIPSDVDILDLSLVRKNIRIKNLRIKEVRSAGSDDYVKIFEDCTIHSGRLINCVLNNCILGDVIVFKDGLCKGEYKVRKTSNI